MEKVTEQRIFSGKFEKSLNEFLRKLNHIDFNVTYNNGIYIIKVINLVGNIYSLEDIINSYPQKA